MIQITKIKQIYQKVKLVKDLNNSSLTLGILMKRKEFADLKKPQQRRKKE